MTVRDNLRLLRRKPEILLVCATAACGGLLFGYDLGGFQTHGILDLKLHMEVHRIAVVASSYQLWRIGQLLRDSCSDSLQKAYRQVSVRRRSHWWSHRDAFLSGDEPPVFLWQ